MESYLLALVLFSDHCAPQTLISNATAVQSVFCRDLLVTKIYWELIATLFSLNEALKRVLSFQF